MKWTKIVAASALSLGLMAHAEAGPFILDLSDADDHGSVSGTTNQSGWFYMQRVLENLAPGVTNGSKTVVSLGSTNTGSSYSSYKAAKSAFDQSSLAGSGWNWVNIDGAGAISAFFNGTGAVNVNNAGIIQLDSGNNNTGGTSGTEWTVINGFGGVIDAFLGGGGALHSQAEGGGGYGWLSALLPGLTSTSFGGSGNLALTAQGQAAFPGLTNADLNAGPYHGHWTGGYGGLAQLFVDSGTGNYGGLPVGIGSAGGSVPQPKPIPEPATLALMGLGLGALAWRRRRANTH